MQLLGALGSDTPVGRFLDKRGPGLHHLGYPVANVTEALGRLRAEGVALIDETAGSRGMTIAFVHPKSMDGVLVELVQEPSQTTPARGSSEDRSGRAPAR